MCVYERVYQAAKLIKTTKGGGDKAKHTPKSAERAPPRNSLVKLLRARCNDNVGLGSDSTSVCALQCAIPSVCCHVGTQSQAPTNKNNSAGDLSY